MRRPPGLLLPLLLFAIVLTAPRAWSRPCSTADDCTNDPCLTGECGVDGNCVGGNDGASCSDGDACTQTDQCQGGVCVGTDPVVCTARDQCHGVGTCDPAAGTCSNPTKPNGTSCTDGDECTQTDTCQSGVCTGSDPVVCPTPDQCHDPGTCNPATGFCSNPPKGASTPCNDGNACTQTDTCQSGVCVGANPVVCTAEDSCHSAGICDPASGHCSNPSKPNNTPCDDGNECTKTDTCQNGTCTGTTPVLCTAQDQCHNPGTCNVTTGVCSNPAKANNTPCNDGNACTQSDTCQNGACTGANPVVCAAQDQCHDAGTCNPASGQCSNPAKANNAPCNDGNGCTQTDSCQNGTCTGTSPVVCPAQDQCHNAGTCDPASGQCSNPAKSNNSPCNDGNACTQNDTCQNGTCTAGNPVTCPTPDQCHDAGVCNVATGLCSNPAKTNNAPCNDGNACTQSDTCQNGTCVGANPVTCPSPDQCHDPATCNPGTGQCSNPAKANNTPCNDGNACTRTDTCQNGTCTGGNPITCPTPDQCHDAGACDAASGQCSNPAKANSTPCNDGNACTRTDTCQGGACVGDTPVVCPTPDQCHVPGACDTTTGQCSNPAKPNGAACNDGDACTRTDACQNGACTGTNPVVCAPIDQCHDAGTCDHGTGACSKPAKFDGSECDDGNGCTIADRCRAGVCGGTALPGCCVNDAACSDGVACTEDRCLPCASGQCLGNYCAHAPLDSRCGAGTDCSVPVCAPGEANADPSGCVARPVDTPIFCTEDRDPCTVDVCRAGACAHDRVTGSDCPSLANPFRAALDLASRDLDVRGTVATANEGACTKLASSTKCAIVGGSESPGPRLVALLDQAHADFEAASMALAGRLPGSASPDAGVRVRLALGLLVNTPGELRAFIATTGQGRGRHMIAAAFAHARQVEARTLLKRTNQLRAQLRRLIAKTQSFAR